MPRRHKTAHCLPEQAAVREALAELFPWIAPAELESLARVAETEPPDDQPVAAAAPRPLYRSAPAAQLSVRRRNGLTGGHWRAVAFQIRLRGHGDTCVQSLRDALDQDEDFEVEQQEGAMVWGYVDYLPGDRASLRRLARVQRMLRRWQVRGYIEYASRRIVDK